ncbi:hypothetical protein PSD17_28380 [Pseudonocardia sp. D17]|nr:hypothetical protein PSD17_28380 [Pseudonocardia sp. D17]
MWETRKGEQYLRIGSIVALCEPVTNAVQVAPYGLRDWSEIDATPGGPARHSASRRYGPDPGKHGR